MPPYLADLGRRTPLNWGVRILFAVGVGFVGYAAATYSLGQSLATSQSDRAYRFAPYDGRLMAELARRDLAEYSMVPSAGSRSQQLSARLDKIEALARDALSRDPTAVPAATTLGLIAQAQGDQATARRWYAYSERLSRRDLPTQMALIEDAVGREDVRSALRHYDTALRTKRGAADLLFPIMTAASTDPVIAAELTRTLATRPVWAPAFIDYLAYNSPELEATVRLFGALQNANVPVSALASSELINALIGKGKFEAAWGYYTLGEPAADRIRLRNPNFNNLLEHPSDFDWVGARGGTGLLTSVQRDASGGVFDFSVPPGLGGRLLAQTQMLPPGTYRLEGRSSGIDQAGGERPYWVLTCRRGGRELGRVEIPNSSNDHGRFVGMLAVPADCPAQELILTARSSDAVGGVTGQIHEVTLHRGT